MTSDLLGSGPSYSPSASRSRAGGLFSDGKMAVMDAAVARTTPRRRWGRLAAALAPAVAFLVVLGIATDRRIDPPRPGDQAPAFDAPLLVGDGSLALAELRGKPVLLNFWASWCVPCEDEAPLLRRAHRVYGNDVAFVGVNAKDARSDAIEFVERTRLDYAHVRDERSVIYDDYGLTGQPETFFIDDEGEIVEHVTGALTRARTYELLDVLVRRAASS